MTPVTDETLGAYLDGQVTPDERAAIERAIAADADVRRRLQDLRAADATLREAYPLPQARMDDPIARRIRSAARGSGVGLRPQALRAPAVALAAGLAGLAVGFFASENRAGDDTLGLPASIANVLETRASGDAERGARVLFSFISHDDTLCRQFAANAATLSGEGVACRDDGRWRLVAWVQAEHPIPGQFQAATGERPLDVIVDRLDRSGPLSDDTERALLARRWRR